MIAFVILLLKSGAPYREFLHVDDLAQACLFLMGLPSSRFGTDASHLYNVGCGEDITIRDLAELVQKVVGFSGEVLWDDSKPDGTPRKLMDVTRMNSLGWQASISLQDGITRVYHDYCKR